jgi:hypothetical protein
MEGVRLLEIKICRKLLLSTLYIPAEDLLPQRKHTGSWDEVKAYLTLEKYVDNSRKVGYDFPGFE